MKPTKHRYSGYASIFVVFVVSLGALLSVWLYQMLVTSTKVASNNIHVSRGSAVAESGLAYMKHKLTEILTANPISGNNTNALLTDMAATINSNGTCAGTAAYSSGQVNIASIAVNDGSPQGSGSHFSTLIVPSTVPGHDFSLRVTGTNGNFSRTIGIEMDKQQVAGFSALHFPMASKGNLNLPSPNNKNAGIYKFVPPSLDTTNRGVEGQYNGIKVVKFTDSLDPIGKVTFPAEPDAMYARLDQLVNNGLRNYNQSANQIGIKNFYIPPNTDPTISGTLTGVIYVQWPNNITIANGTVINGVIIYAKATDSTTTAISIDRQSSLTITPPSMTDLQELFGTGSNWTKCGDFTTGWAIIAPATNFSIKNGTLEGIKTIGGSIHVNDYSGEGSGNVLKKMPATGELVVNPGSIVCEGNISLSGTNAFSVNPPTGGVGGWSTSSNYTLEISLANYWEQ